MAAEVHFMRAVFERAASDGNRPRESSGGGGGGGGSSASPGGPSQQAAAAAGDWLTFADIMTAFASVSREKGVDAMVEHRCYQAILRMASQSESYLSWWERFSQLSKYLPTSATEIEFEVDDGHLRSAGSSRRTSTVGGSRSASPSSGSPSSSLNLTSSARLQSMQRSLRQSFASARYEEQTLASTAAARTSLEDLQEGRDLTLILNKNKFILDFSGVRNGSSRSPPRMTSRVLDRFGQSSGTHDHYRRGDIVDYYQHSILHSLASPASEDKLYASDVTLELSKPRNSYSRSPSPSHGHSGLSMHQRVHHSEIKGYSHSPYPLNDHTLLHLSDLVGNESKAEEKEAVNGNSEAFAPHVIAKNVNVAGTGISNNRNNRTTEGALMTSPDVSPITARTRRRFSPTAIQQALEPPASANKSVRFADDTGHGDREPELSTNYHVTSIDSYANSNSDSKEISQNGKTVVNAAGLRARLRRNNAPLVEHAGDDTSSTSTLALLSSASSSLKANAKVIDTKLQESDDVEAIIDAIKRSTNSPLRGSESLPPPFTTGIESSVADPPSETVLPNGRPKIGLKALIAKIKSGDTAFADTYSTATAQNSFKAQQEVSYSLMAAANGSSFQASSPPSPDPHHMRMSAASLSSNANRSADSKEDSFTFFSPPANNKKSPSIQSSGNKNSSGLLLTPGQKHVLSSLSLSSPSSPLKPQISSSDSLMSPVLSRSSGGNNSSNNRDQSRLEDHTMDYETQENANPSIGDTNTITNAADYLEAAHDVQSALVMVMLLQTWLCSHSPIRNYLLNTGRPTSIGYSDSNYQSHLLFANGGLWYRSKAMILHRHLSELAEADPHRVSSIIGFSNSSVTTVPLSDLFGQERWLRESFAKVVAMHTKADVFRILGVYSGVMDPHHVRIRSTSSAAAHTLQLTSYSVTMQRALLRLKRMVMMGQFLRKRLTRVFNPRTHTSFVVPASLDGSISLNNSDDAYSNSYDLNSHYLMSSHNNHTAVTWRLHTAESATPSQRNEMRCTAILSKFSFSTLIHKHPKLLENYPRLSAFMRRTRDVQFAHKAYLRLVCRRFYRRMAYHSRSLSIQRNHRKRLLHRCFSVMLEMYTSALQTNRRWFQTIDSPAYQSTRLAFAYRRGIAALSHNVAYRAFRNKQIAAFVAKLSGYNNRSRILAYKAIVALRYPMALKCFQRWREQYETNTNCLSSHKIMSIDRHRRMQCVKRALQTWQLLTKAARFIIPTLRVANKSQSQTRTMAHLFAIQLHRLLSADVLCNSSLTHSNANSNHVSSNVKFNAWLHSRSRRRILARRKALKYAIAVVFIRRWRALATSKMRVYFTLGDFMRHQNTGQLFHHNRSRRSSAMMITSGKDLYITIPSRTPHSLLTTVTKASEGHGTCLMAFVVHAAPNPSDHTRSQRRRSGINDSETKPSRGRMGLWRLRRTLILSQTNGNAANVSHSYPFKVSGWQQHEGATNLFSSPFVHNDGSVAATQSLPQWVNSSARLLVAWRRWRRRCEAAVTRNIAANAIKVKSNTKVKSQMFHNWREIYISRRFHQTTLLRIGVRRWLHFHSVYLAYYAFNDPTSKKQKINRRRLKPISDSKNGAQFSATACKHYLATAFGAFVMQLRHLRAMKCLPLLSFSQQTINATDDQQLGVRKVKECVERLSTVSLRHLIKFKTPLDDNSNLNNGGGVSLISRLDLHSSHNRSNDRNHSTRSGEDDNDASRIELLLASTGLMKPLNRSSVGSINSHSISSYNNSDSIAQLPRTTSLTVLQHAAYRQSYRSAIRSFLRRNASLAYIRALTKLLHRCKQSQKASKAVLVCQNRTIERKAHLTLIHWRIHSRCQRLTRIVKTRRLRHWVTCWRATRVTTAILRRCFRHKWYRLQRRIAILRFWQRIRSKWLKDAFGVLKTHTMRTSISERQCTMWFAHRSIQVCFVDWKLMMRAARWMRLRGVSVVIKRLKGFMIRSRMATRHLKRLVVQRWHRKALLWARAREVEGAARLAVMRVAVRNVIVCWAHAVRDGKHAAVAGGNNLVTRAAERLLLRKRNVKSPPKAYSKAAIVATSALNRLPNLPVYLSHFLQDLRDGQSRRFRLVKLWKSIGDFARNYVIYNCSSISLKSGAVAVTAAGAMAHWRHITAQTLRAKHINSKRWLQKGLSALRRETRRRVTARAIRTRQLRWFYVAEFKHRVQRRIVDLKKMCLLAIRFHCAVILIRGLHTWRKRVTQVVQQSGSRRQNASQAVRAGRYCERRRLQLAMMRLKSLIGLSLAKKWSHPE